MVIAQQAVAGTVLGRLRPALRSSSKVQNWTVPGRAQRIAAVSAARPTMNAVGKCKKRTALKKCPIRGHSRPHY